MRITLAFVGVSALLANCGGDGQAPTTAAPGQTPTAASESPSPEGVSALEGTWTTPPISPADAESALRRNGLGEFIKRFRPLTPLRGDTVLILDIGEEWDLYGQVDGGPREEIDFDADYSVEGDEVEVIHSEGSNTHRWSVDGDTLTLEWLRTTLPPYKGISEEVFQTVLYETEAFTRQS
jgi:hypothetical protein